MSFQLDLTNFGNQNNQIRHRYTRSSYSGHDEILTRTWPDRVRSRRFWPFFCVFRRVSASPETDATQQQTDTRNPTLLTGRLQVENLPTRSLTGRLRVGYKPDPWTPLHVTVLLSHLVVPLLYLTFYGFILTLCSSNNTCDNYFATFVGSFIFFSHLTVPSSHCAIQTSHLTVLLSHLIVPLFFFHI